MTQGTRGARSSTNVLKIINESATFPYTLAFRATSLFVSNDGVDVVTISVVTPDQTESIRLIVGKSGSFFFGKPITSVNVTAGTTYQIEFGE